MIEHNISTPKPARVKETFTLNNATIFGGGNLLADYAEAVGLKALFLRNLAVGKAPWATYEMHETMAAFVLGTALGLGRIFHFTGLEDGPLLAIKTGWPKMPDHTAFYHDIHRFDTTEKAGSPRPVPEGPWTNAASSTSIPRWKRSMAARKARRPDITTASTDA